MKKGMFVKNTFSKKAQPRTEGEGDVIQEETEDGLEVDTPKSEMDERSEDIDIETAEI